MKLILAVLLMISSAFSFASDDDVLMAIVHDIKTSSFSCNWSDMLNTMSDLQAQFKVAEYLQAPATLLDIHEDAKVPYVDAVSTWRGGLKVLTSRIFLSADASRVTRVDFVFETLRESKVNTGTILRPSYETQTTSHVDYKASCLVR